MRISRRQWLGYSVGGSLIPAWVIAGDDAAAPSMLAGPDPVPWPYRKTDPLRAERLGYENFFKGGCCYGVFAAIMQQLIQDHGEPYRRFPLRMMEYGNGGVGGYGSLCGAANGGAAVIGLFSESKARGALITRLLQWYEQTELPLYQPEKADGSAIVLPGAAAQSVICRVSITNWCAKSGFKPDSAERKERCARLTADVSRKTSELLNA